jgi:hypothetical protein
MRNECRHGQPPPLDRLESLRWSSVTLVLRPVAPADLPGIFINSNPRRQPTRTRDTMCVFQERPPDAAHHPPRRPRRLPAR